MPPRRLQKLLEDMANEKENKTLIFVETKRKADDLTRRMKRDGWPVTCIHGDKSQQEREWVLNSKCCRRHTRPPRLTDARIN